MDESYAFSLICEGAKVIFAKQLEKLQLFVILINMTLAFPLGFTIDLS